MRTALVIPTYNACSGDWEGVLKAISSQNLQPDMKFIIDSSSMDATVEVAKKYGFEFSIIEQKAFNHGLTRQSAADKFSGFDIIIFMTQDSLLMGHSSLSNLLAAFDDPLVSAAYGRQIPGENSSLSEKTARNFNYPPVSRIKSMVDVSELGLHTAFCSDSFAAYRIKDLKALGGFPETDFAEDMLMAARMLMAGKRVAYRADAMCIHSHSYCVKSEFKRGVAIGRMHAKNPWLLKNFGGAEKRGAKLMAFVPLSLRIPLFLQNMPKYVGYVAAKMFYSKKTND